VNVPVSFAQDWNARPFPPPAVCVVPAGLRGCFTERLVSEYMCVAWRPWRSQTCRCWRQVASIESRAVGQVAAAACSRAMGSDWPRRG
jgi:hypothetical protein